MNDIFIQETGCGVTEYGAYSAALTDAVRELFGDDKATAYIAYTTSMHTDRAAQKKRALHDINRMIGRAGHGVDLGTETVAIILGNGKHLLIWASEWAVLQNRTFVSE